MNIIGDGPISAVSKFEEIFRRLFLSRHNVESIDAWTHKILRPLCKNEEDE